MIYKAFFDLQPEGLHLEDVNISIEKDGLAYGKGRIDYADILSLKPVNHRVIISLLEGKQAVISMLGFSFDGFWEELLRCFGVRTAESLFIEEEKLMECDAEYQLPVLSNPMVASGILPYESIRNTDVEMGRGRVQLYTDSICILPETCHAIRVPLCFTSDISLDGYLLHIRMRGGEEYMVGRMGNDTHPFAERAIRQAKKVKEKREERLFHVGLTEPFTEKGLFRTADEDTYWLAAFGKNSCAVELFTAEKTATYLYIFMDKRLFVYALEEAMEAVGTHRELIFLPEEELVQKPLYRMAVARSGAVRFLRRCSAGRIIHSATHDEKLREFLDLEKVL